MGERIRDHLRFEGGVRLCTYSSGMEARDIRDYVFPGVGRKCGKVQISGECSDKSKSRSLGIKNRLNFGKA